ncbi:unnamed protein product [Prunus armeniaca]|uniref:Major facilitator superfamily (MFS) profile domain-containing protein n=1 Tax=Prunus armeniaca TaxID=36596 RepID=A0A6J5WGQ3_PRUAR|nr:unnamed protein product [Prunus armeniaca]
MIISNRSSKFALFSKEFLRRHGLHLLGTATTWFLLDIAYYSQKLFQKDIFSAVGWLPSAGSMSALDELYKIARAQTLIALCGTVPGAAEVFPARFPSTCHGISAASDKAGAIIGARYPPGIGMRNSLIVLGVISILGFFFKFLVPKGKSLEEMSRENEDEGAQVQSNEVELTV